MDGLLHLSWMGHRAGEGNTEAFSLISALFMPILAHFSPFSTLFQPISAHFSPISLPARDAMLSGGDAAR